MLAQFPNLRKVWYESWREWEWRMQPFTDKRECTVKISTAREFTNYYPGFLLDNQTLIESLARGNLRKLVIFKNIYQLYPHILGANLYFKYNRNPNRNRIPIPIVPQKLVRAGLSLEVLSVSFMVDAGYFFKKAKEEPCRVSSGL
jgi:hypothetical protein